MHLLEDRSNTASLAQKIERSSMTFFTLWKALMPASIKHPSVEVLLNISFPKYYYLNVYKCGQACRQHALYEDQMLSKSRKESGGIQSIHCLPHFAFSIHGNLALWRCLSQHAYTVCYMQYACLHLVLWLWVYFKSCVCMT